MHISVSNIINVFIFKLSYVLLSKNTSLPTDTGVAVKLSGISNCLKNQRFWRKLVYRKWVKNNSFLQTFIIFALQYSTDAGVDRFSKN